MAYPSRGRSQARALRTVCRTGLPRLESVSLPCPVDASPHEPGVGPRCSWAPRRVSTARKDPRLVRPQARETKSRMDDRQQQRINSAAQQFTDALVAAYRTASDNTVVAQQLGARQIEYFFDTVIDNLRTQAEGASQVTRQLASQQRLAREATRDLTQASTDNYMDLLDSVFAFYQGGTSRTRRRAEEAQRRIEEAEARAEQAHARAEEAERIRSEAERQTQEAKRSAGEAQRRVKEAEKSARAAQRRAEEAESSAEEAQRRFEEAEARAEEVQGRAEQGESDAEQAHGRAEEADRRAGEAEERAEEADRRAEEADRRAEEADRRTLEAERRAAEAESSSSEAESQGGDTQADAVGHPLSTWLRTLLHHRR